MNNGKLIIRFSAINFKIDHAYGLKMLLRNAVAKTLEHEGFERSCEVSITICDEDYIRRLNAEYRGKDAVTDVLSFPMFDMMSEELPYDEILPLGDIVICADQARRQAEALSQSFDREMVFLCIHSMLHLLGYDHELSDADERIMIEKQKKIISRFE